MGMLGYFVFSLFFIGFTFFFVGIHNYDLSHNMLMIEKAYSIDLVDYTAGGNLIEYEDSYRTAVWFEMLGLMFCCIGAMLLGKFI